MPECKTERHHIFPRGLFGDNNRVVRLTLREHFIAHLLLWKHYASRGGGWRRDKMAHAAWMMRVANNERLNSHLYETLKTQHAVSVSKRQTGRKHSEESKRIRSEKMLGRKQTPEHRANLKKVAEGRIRWTNGTENKWQKECPGEGWRRGTTRRSGYKRKPHSVETRAKLSLSAKEASKGRRRDSKGHFAN